MTARSVPEQAVLPAWGWLSPPRVPVGATMSPCHVPWGHGLAWLAPPLLSWMSQQCGDHSVFWGCHPWGGAVPLSPIRDESVGIPRHGLGDKSPSGGQEGGPGGVGEAEGGVPSACSRVPRRASHMPLNFTASALDGSLVIFGEPSHKFVPPHCSELRSGDGGALLPGTVGTGTPCLHQGRGTPGWAAIPVTLLG